MTSSGLKRLISPAICLPNFCPISSTISIHKRSSLFTEAMISSKVIGLLMSPIRLDKIEFSPFCIRSSKMRCSADPEASVSRQPFLPQWQIISLSKVLVWPNSPGKSGFSCINFAIDDDSNT